MSLFPILSALLVASTTLSLISRKWCLPLRPTGPIILIAAIVAALAGWNIDRFGLHPFLIFVLTGATEGTAFVVAVAWFFYRDPERTIPSEPGAIVSPADGTVIYIRRLSAREPIHSEKNGAHMILDELRDSPIADIDLWQIGISMVFTDVHVNRAPISGTVSLLYHRPGKFLSLRRHEALNQNERQTILISGTQIQVALVQIASRLVRQIRAYVEAGEEIAIGQRIGMIRFGSQVDLFVPTDATKGPLLVEVGQRLTAGVTTIGFFGD